jgi:hypothetical protein
VHWPQLRVGGATSWGRAVTATEKRRRMIREMRGSGEYIVGFVTFECMSVKVGGYSVEILYRVGCKFRESDVGCFIPSICDSLCGVVARCVMSVGFDFGCSGKRGYRAGTNNSSLPDQSD